MGKTEPIPPIVAKVQERGLAVSASEAATFPFDAIDVLTAQHMLAGINTPKGLASTIGGVTEIAMMHRLLDPVRCAWISQQLNAAISTRLGQVLTSVYGRAITTGDPRAAELLLRQYGQLVAPVSRTEHLELKADLSQLPTEVLEKLVADKMRALGIANPPPIKDADFEAKEETMHVPGEE